MPMRRLLTVALLTALTGACSRSAPPVTTTQGSAPGAQGSVTSSDPGRKYLLERVDDAAVVQLYADGFSALPLGEKTLIWHLYQAALAGRDIFIDQKHRSALEMRGVIDQ